ncbi:unnamed protein product [Bursaphelenchus xylophilus]|uniref:(pine wood nematode) hypothetical protein n=1 Tax=Bursaphelenchus xylophilus TaxID=6326 RepID=A0A1I7SBA4_BURXY|nr:unnamed protein product [Bursaphelenchus xylophilus]CAG9131988.1 unnamed protein product [Bursaphelenchus xylophilus]
MLILKIQQVRVQRDRRPQIPGRHGEGRYWLRHPQNWTSLSARAHRQQHSIRTCEGLQDYKLLNYDGVFGLGFGEVNGLSSPIKQLAHHGVIPSALLTAYIYNQGHNNTVDGVLTIGEVDKRRCGAVEGFAETVRAADAWVFSSPSFNISTTNGTSNGSWLGVLDFNTDYFQVPRAAVKLIQNKLSGSIDEDGRIIYHCFKYAELFFNIGGQPLALDTPMFSEPYRGQMCRLKIKETDPSDKYAFRFGWLILHRHCMVLDYNGRLAFTPKTV